MLKPFERNKPFVSAQPENRTVIEEALEYAWYKLLADVDKPYPNLKQPINTPSEFLNLLASERGVLDWFPDDTQSQRRVTTHNAFEIHSKAGTRSGLVSALSALDIDSTVKKGVQPYSIEVEGKLSERPLTEETSKRLNSRITHYKSERDSVSLSLLRSSYATKNVGCLMRSARFIHIYAGVPEPPVFYGANGKFGFIQSEKVIKVEGAK